MRPRAIEERALRLAVPEVGVEAERAAGLLTQFHERAVARRDFFDVGKTLLACRSPSTARAPKQGVACACRRLAVRAERISSLARGARFNPTAF